MGAHLDVGALQAQGPADTGYVEGETSVVDDPTDAPQHLGLRLQGCANGVGTRFMNLPVPALGVDDTGDVPLRSLGLRQRQTNRVESGDSDARHRGQGQGGVMWAGLRGGVGRRSRPVALRWTGRCVG